MMEIAKREPQVQGRKFSLGSCLAVTWVSLPRAPRQLDISQARSPFALTMADMDFMGLLQQLWRMANQREVMIWRPSQPNSEHFYTHKPSHKPDSDESPCLVWLILSAPHQTQASTGQILPSWYCLVKAIIASCFSDCKAFGCSWRVQWGNTCGHILHTQFVSIQFFFLTLYLF